MSALSLAPPSKPALAPPAPCPLDDEDVRLVALLASYARYRGVALAPSVPALYDLPAVVLAHGLEDPPIFFYANRAAQGLFEYDFATLTSLPSRESAQPDAREVRAAFLEEVRTQGYVANYSGIRIAASGRRFQIEDAFVWNIVDAHGERLGHAATFGEVRYVVEP